MYVCGMTIYDLCHVGHARFMMAFDMVQRWLRTLGYGVTYVRNITDIDDKIIRRALERGIPIRAADRRDDRGHARGPRRARHRAADARAARHRARRRSMLRHDREARAEGPGAIARRTAT